MLATDTRWNPVARFLDQQGVLILDGGLASELEARGCDLHHDLWSARLLLDDPELVRAVHLDYLEAGADCLVSASYQASLAGFHHRGLSETEAAEAIRSSVRLAIDARDTFWRGQHDRVRRLRPIVAASVGPYGAFLADGSEYTGLYDVGRTGLIAFHRDRWHILGESGADLLACETIPSRVEAQVLLQLLRETPEVHAWFSFSCRDGYRMSDGTPISEVVTEFRDQPQVVAVGINCTAPRFVPSLIRAVRTGVEQPILVYPNSGEAYDAESKRWVGQAEAVDFGQSSEEWRQAGATLIGGCCRTGPEHIRAIRQRLL